MKNLSNYIDRLEFEGELVRVKAEVDPVLEIAEITDRMSKSLDGGRALLFESLLLSDGSVSPFPVATNLFGSRRRIEMALGGELDELSQRIDNLLRDALSPKSSLGEKLGVLPLLGKMARWFPVRGRGRGECQRVVLDGGLEKLPILKCWPHDGGKFITLPLVHTVDPDTNARNVGMYRMQIFDDRTTGMHWHVHKTGARHFEAYKRLGIRRMPVSVCLGGDPAYTYAATAPMPDGMDEYLLAGFLGGRAVRLVKCLTNDLWVPSDCDFVIEGYIDVFADLRTEGPFGDHTGFYSLEDPYPVFHVECITHRRDAVFPATIVGVPPQEDAYFAEVTERIFLPPIRRALQPEVRDLYMPPEGVAHNLAIVSIDVSYPAQAQKVASALWGAGQMMFCKVLIAVPSSVDVRNRATVMSLLQRLDPASDLTFSHGVADVLDHATAIQGTGSKLLIDLTHPRNGRPKFVFTFDTGAVNLNFEDKLWLGLANLDPAHDITIDGQKITVDCRVKLSENNLRSGRWSGKAHESTNVGVASPQRWPNVVVSSEETIALVDRRWEEYGLGEFLPSPSSRYRKLLLSGSAAVE